MLVFRYRSVSREVEFLAKWPASGRRRGAGRQSKFEDLTKANKQGSILLLHHRNKPHVFPVTGT